MKKLLLVIVTFIALFALIYFGNKYMYRNVSIDSILKPVDKGGNKLKLLLNDTPRSTVTLSDSENTYEVSIVSADEYSFTVDPAHQYCGAPTLDAKGYKGDYTLRIKDPKSELGLRTHEFISGTLHDGSLRVTQLQAFNGNKTQKKTVVYFYGYSSCTTEKLFIFGIDEKEKTLVAYTFQNTVSGINKYALLASNSISQDGAVAVDGTGNLVTKEYNAETGKFSTVTWKLNLDTNTFSEISRISD